MDFHCRHVLAKKIKEWEPVFPLYYGWFLHITDTKLLIETNKVMLFIILSIIFIIVITFFIIVILLRSR